MYNSINSEDLINVYIMCYVTNPIELNSCKYPFNKAHNGHRIYSIKLKYEMFRLSHNIIN